MSDPALLPGQSVTSMVRVTILILVISAVAIHSYTPSNPLQVLDNILRRYSNITPVLTTLKAAMSPSITRFFVNGGVDSAHEIEKTISARKDTPCFVCWQEPAAFQSVGVWAADWQRC